MARNTNLTRARVAANDEFYTQYEDIQCEMNAYLDYDPNVFRGKTVLLPCDDPEWSNFTQYFVERFEVLGLKKLISTSYAPRSKGNTVDLSACAITDSERNNPNFDIDLSFTRGRLFVLNEGSNRHKTEGMSGVPWFYMEGDGDFRSPEVTALRDEADIIITNPPFSLFREYISWILDAATPKKFVTVANKNCITYKEIFPLIKNNLMWVGRTSLSQDMLFTSYKEIDPKDYPPSATKKVDGKVYLRSPSVWFTNIDHGRRHQPLNLDTMANNLRHNKKMKGKSSYEHYDNYDAIEIPSTNAIPADYDGIMGVPISFMDKYCPAQFEILGCNRGVNQDGEKIYGRSSLINGKETFKRIFIRRKK